MKLLLDLKKITRLFFLIGVFFIPFNSFEGFGLLGEFDRDSCVVFFLIAFGIMFFWKKISIPFRSTIFQLLIVLLLWFVISVVFNFHDVTHYYFKNTSGITRFLRQYTSVIISSILLFLVFYNVIKTHSFIDIIYKIRTVILYSLIVVVIYGTIEYLILKFKINSLRNVLYLFDYFPFTSVNIDRYTFRMSSVTFEPPALATYLISISGWMFSYILTNKGYMRFIPALLVVLFSFLSGSRAGFFIIIVQVFVFLMFLLKDKKFKKLFVNFLLVSIFGGMIVILLFGKKIGETFYEKLSSFKTDDDIHANSNKTRFGIQYAMFQVFLENPITGTGYSLQAFESKDKYPDWATKNNWEFRLKHLNEDHKSFPPGFNLYLRLLAETGIIGFLIFTLFITYILLWCFNNTFKKSGDQTIIALLITISMVGFIFNWLKMDTFRVYGFWLTLAILIIEEQRLKVNEKN